MASSITGSEPIWIILGWVGRKCEKSATEESKTALGNFINLLEWNFSYIDEKTDRKNAQSSRSEGG